MVAHKLVDALLRHALRDWVGRLVVGQGNGQVGQVQLLAGGKDVIDVIGVHVVFSFQTLTKFLCFGERQLSSSLVVVKIVTCSAAWPPG